jgi:hypothetical protein
MLRVIKAAGLLLLKKKIGESDERFAVRVVESVMESGQEMNLLGGLLIPAELEDVDWRPRIAAETIEHCRKITDADEKRNLHTVILEATLFLVHGILSSGPSRIASGPPAKQNAPQQEGATIT